MKNEENEFYNDANCVISDEIYNRICGYISNDDPATQTNSDASLLSQQ